MQYIYINFYWWFSSWNVKRSQCSTFRLDFPSNFTLVLLMAFNVWYPSTFTSALLMAFVVKYNVLLILNLNIFTDYTLSIMLVLIFSRWDTNVAIFLLFLCWYEIFAKILSCTSMPKIHHALPTEVRQNAIIGPVRASLSNILWWNFCYSCHGSKACPEQIEICVRITLFLSMFLNNIL